MAQVGVWLNCAECGEDRAYFNPANQTLDSVSCRSCGARIDRWHAFGHAPWCVSCGDDLSDCVCPDVSDALISLERIVAGLSAPVREGSAEDVDPDAFRAILAEGIADAHAILSRRFGGE